MLLVLTLIFQVQVVEAPIQLAIEEEFGSKNQNKRDTDWAGQWSD